MTTGDSTLNSIARSRVISTCWSKRTSGGDESQEANRAARIAMGEVTQLRESDRERRGLSPIETLFKDLRYAGRTLARSPGFTAVAVLTRAFGIGLNTTLFTAVNAVALKPLPVKDVDNLVRMERWFESANPGNIQYAYSYSEYVFFRDHNRTLSSVIAASFMFPALAELPQPRSSDTNSEQPSLAVQGQLVSGNYFSDLGVKTIVGRNRRAHLSRRRDRNPRCAPRHRPQLPVLAASFQRRSTSVGQDRDFERHAIHRRRSHF